MLFIIKVNIKIMDEGDSKLSLSLLFGSLCDEETGSLLVCYLSNNYMCGGEKVLELTSVFNLKCIIVNMEILT